MCDLKFSEKLKKVFIDINKNIGIRFRWNNMNSTDVKYIRALPVYTQDDWLRIPVERCPMHKCYEDNLNLGKILVKTWIQITAYSKS